MASANLVVLVGNLTREPESRGFANGGKVVTFGIAINEKKKNQATGQWEDAPNFFDCKVFNSERRQLADLCEQYLRKGSPVYLQGKLSQETWDDKTSGQKRSKVVIIAHEVQFLSSKKDSESRQQEPAYEAPKPAAVASSEGDDSLIPF